MQFAKRRKIRNSLALAAIATFSGPFVATTEAGFIPWAYNAVFGYGPAFPNRGAPMAYGAGYGPSAPYYNGGFYGGGYSTQMTSSYGPYYGGGVDWSAGYGYGGYGCATNYGCNPCGGSPCGVGCSGTANCGCDACGNDNCNTGNAPPLSNGPTPDNNQNQQKPAEPQTQPTYRKDPPPDEFVPVRPRDQESRPNLPNSTIPGSPRTNQPAPGMPGGGSLPNSSIPGGNLQGNPQPGNSGFPNSNNPAGNPGSMNPNSGVPGSTVPSSGLPGSSIPNSSIPNMNQPAGAPATTIPGSSLPGGNPAGSSIPNANDLPGGANPAPKENPSSSFDLFKMPTDLPREPAPLDPTNRPASPAPEQKNEESGASVSPIDTDLQLTADVRVARRRVLRDASYSTPAVVRVDVVPGTVVTSTVETLAQK
ncbi:hypothetical protein [Planctomicrobium sp. SH527]|uniref:hypothetical protein n=1 Tax=Planctomicrobium sp. SH527 TaxID=3448123 RepID=UPI003F5B600B